MILLDSTWCMTVMAAPSLVWQDQNSRPRSMEECTDGRVDRIALCTIYI